MRLAIFAIALPGQGYSDLVVRNVCRDRGGETKRDGEKRFGDVQSHLSMEVQMTDSVYKVVTLVGTSTESWEKAAKAAVDAASHSLRELRIAEVVKQDMVITDGKVEAYRTKIRVSFKYEDKE